MRTLSKKKKKNILKKKVIRINIYSAVFYKGMGRVNKKIDKNKILINKKKFDLDLKIISKYLLKNIIVIT